MRQVVVTLALDGSLTVLSKIALRWQGCSLEGLKGVGQWSQVQGQFRRARCYASSSVVDFQDIEWRWRRPPRREIYRPSTRCRNGCSGPCLPSSGDFAEAVYAIGLTPVAVENSSFGAVKALFR